MLDKLQPRERLVLIVGSILVGVTLFGLGAVKLLSLRAEKRETALQLERLADQVERQVRQIQQMRESGQPPGSDQFKGEIARLLQNNNLQTQQFDLDDEEAAGMVRYTLQVRMSQVPLHKMFRVLYSLEYAQPYPVEVSFLQLRRSVSARDVYEVSIKISTTVPAPEQQ